MKKILFWSAVTIIAAVSCNKLENDTLTPSNAPAFEAYVDGAESKTVIDGMASYWDGTERIWVLNGQSGNAGWKKAYKATATKATRVTFKEENNVMLTGDDYLAVYPAEPAGDVTWDGKVSSPAKKFWLPGDQIAKEGTYDPSTHVAVAYTLEGNPNLEFKNVTSLVKFTLQSDNVSEVVFYGLNNDVITGNFDVTYNNGNPTYTNTGSGYSKNTFVRVKPTSGNLTKGKTYYMSVLPRTFSKGFAIEMVVNGVKATKTVSKSYTLKRNQILDLGNLKVSVKGWKKTLYLVGNSNFWHQAYAKFDAWIWGGSVSGQWVDFTYVKDDLYSTIVPWDVTNLNLYRRDPNATSHDFDGNQWNSIRNISLNGNNCISITDWGSCSLSKKKDL